MRKFFFLFALLLGAVTAPAFAEDTDTTDYFDLSTINSIYGDSGSCTYNEEKGAYFLQTDTYGFWGWEYSTSIDLSGYSKIVIELAEAQTDGAQFRLFDTNSYWGNYAEFDFDNDATSLTIDLDTVTTVDLSHIYIAGFWTYGPGDDEENPNGIYIKSITLYQSNNDENQDEDSTNDGTTTTDYFPLDKINPSIYETGTCTYDDDKDAYFLQTGEYGFGGWEYDPAIDLSEYGSIVIDLVETDSYDGAEFRLVTGSYSDDNEAIYTFNGKELSIDLTKMEADETNGIKIGEYFELSNITMAGFWTYGAGSDNNGIYIKSITLYDTDGNKVSTGINTLPALTTQNRNGVYTLTGVKVSDDDSCLKSLSRGIYIVNGRKVAIR